MVAGPGDGALALLRLLGDLPGEKRVEEPLAPYTTFRIGGPAWVLFKPATTAALVEALHRVRSQGIPHRLLGGGAKVLFPDEGFPGLVLHTGSLRHIQKRDGTVWVEPGLPIAELVGMGLWELAGVPGTAGGAVVMNAGTRFGSISCHVVGVEALLPSGNTCLFSPAECRFRYRSSLFREEGLAVLNVGLQLPREKRPVGDILAERRRSQPLEFPSAGCVFRNPEEGPSAGWLIDQAGFKGARVGDAQVSPRHANFICNLGRARAREVLELVERVREGVARAFGLGLALELEVVRP